MGFIELFILGIGLSMDAFAVAICKGLCMQKLNYKNTVIIGAFFGGFQALMPLVGYILGTQFKDSITAFDHWIAFILLALIGLNMIRESRYKDEISCENVDVSLSIKNMTLLSIATSIDALAVGITFAFLQVNIIPAISIIGITTFIISVLGVKIGHVFGSKYKSKAELAGGIILIIIGLKILFEHLGII